VGPNETGAQQLGREAESTFASAAVARGHLWHPTASGNDFGVDGVIELVAKGSVTGRIAGVQIKGTDRLKVTPDGSIRLPTIKLSTASYWFARIQPTLIVVWERPTSNLLWTWAHDLLPIEEFSALVRRNQTTARLVMKVPRTLDASGWDDVEAEINALHVRTVRAMNERHVREICESLLCRVADAQDVLVEWITWIGYGSPEALARRFDGVGNPEGLLASFRNLALAPPLLVTQPDVLAIMTNPIHQLRVLLRYFSHTMRSGWGYDSDQPVLHAAEAFAVALDAYYSLIFPPDQRSIALAWGDNWDPETMDSVGFWIDIWIQMIPVINLLLRDFERELRGLLFAHFSPQDERTESVIQFVDRLITPVSEWHRNWSDEEAHAAGEVPPTKGT
jgi:hypothetical protein